jgi:hypothetical protein
MIASVFYALGAIFGLLSVCQVLLGSGDHYKTLALGLLFILVANQEALK